MVRRCLPRWVREAALAELVGLGEVAGGNEDGAEVHERQVRAPMLPPPILAEPTRKPRREAARDAAAPGKGGEGRGQPAAQAPRS